MNPSVPGRLHALDALRGFALLLGVALHASMSYLPGAKYFWIIADSNPSTTLSILFFTIHVFRMTLFFLIAGFFARLALDRLGLKAFTKDRWQRIALPLLAFWPIVFSLIIAVVIWSAWLAHGGELPKNPPPGPSFMPDDFPLTHLWFLYVLLIFYSAAVLLRVLLNRIDRNGVMRSVMDRITRVALGRLAPVVLAIPATIILITNETWIPWFGIPTPDKSLYVNSSALVAYGTAFCAGWLLRGAQDFLYAWQRSWPLHLTLALLCTGSCLALVGVVPSGAVNAQSTRDFAFAAGYCVASWSWTLALIGLALRYTSEFNVRRRFLANASYWMYLMHLPLVMALQVLASRVAWPWQIEYALVLGVCVAILLLSYQWMVRNSFIGARLNGRRDAS